MSTKAALASLDEVRASLLEIAAEIERPSAWAALRPRLRAVCPIVERLGHARAACALERIAELLEIGECLGAEGPDCVAAIARDGSEGLVNLADGLLTEDADALAANFLGATRDRWGAYLDLLEGTGPSLTGVEDEGPEWGLDVPGPVEEESVDQGALFRLLGLGGLEPGPSEPDQGEAEIRSAANQQPPPSRGVRPIGPARDDDRPERPSQAPSTAEPDGDPGPAAPEATEASREAAELAALDPELRATFLAELKDLFERAQGLVLRLDRGERGPDITRELGRCFHTLKGSAGSVGLGSISERVHDLEDTLAVAAIDEPLLARLHDELAALDALLSPPESRAPREERPIDAEADTGPDSYVRISERWIEALQDQVSDLIGRRGAWSAASNAFRELEQLARGVRARLLAVGDHLEDLGAFLPARANDLTGLRRVVRELGEDLGVLASTARQGSARAADEGTALERQGTGMWDVLQSIRAVPAHGLFQRLERVAYDAARVEERLVEVAADGAEVGLDRSVQDEVYEPLLHIVRNAVAHGIETAETRRAAGKPPRGRVTLRARREGHALVLEVEDDGRGLDDAAIAAKGRRLGLLAPDELPSPERVRQLIFHPGFSTRAEANAVAGRGVGMDVVAREVANLHGTIAMSSRLGQGTRFTLRIPARIALEQVLVVKVGTDLFALPFAAIEGVEGPTANGHDELPRLNLARVLGTLPPPAAPQPRLLMVRVEGSRHGVLVDDIVGPQDLVVRPLPRLLAGHPVLSGASLSSNGEIVLMLDLAGLVAWNAGIGPGPAPLVDAQRDRRALVVDDSASVRRMMTRHLGALGYAAEEARDGIEALRAAREGGFDLIVTDIDMPRMDGLAFLAELRRVAADRVPPILVASTRSDEATRARAKALGVRVALVKPVEFEALAQAVAGLPGPVAQSSKPERGL